MIDNEMYGSRYQLGRRLAVNTCIMNDFVKTDKREATWATPDICQDKPFRNIASFRYRKTLASGPKSTGDVECEPCYSVCERNNEVDLTAWSHNAWQVDATMKNGQGKKLNSNFLTYCPYCHTQPRSKAALKKEDKRAILPH
ncbi:hypothetical protein BaRGS_00010806 [Batillaria attramentaria]|uniref:HNH domain-containing protein n=1 Tax=Batillaria attramentaria TaxID=370345 RepID=A0ABD0LEZ6_9CAEN